MTRIEYNMDSIGRQRGESEEITIENMNISITKAIDGNRVYDNAEDWYHDKNPFCFRYCSCSSRCARTCLSTDERHTGIAIFIKKFHQLSFPTARSETSKERTKATISKSASNSQLFLGAAPRVPALNRLVIISPVICAFPFTTPKRCQRQPTQLTLQHRRIHVPL